MRRMHPGVTAAASAVAVYILLGRPRQLRWGATNREYGEPLPGDDLIADPDLTATRAITIRAPASQVWPWIVQLGQGRGGFYSYDFLENLIGCDIHSAGRIVPEWQDLKPGDQVKLAPQAGLAVAHLEPGRSVVLRGGVPSGNSAPPYDFTWAFVVKDEQRGGVRADAVRYCQRPAGNTGGITGAYRETSRLRPHTVRQRPLGCARGR